MGAVLAVALGLVGQRENMRGLGLRVEGCAIFGYCPHPLTACRLLWTVNGGLGFRV